MPNRRAMSTGSIRLNQSGTWQARVRQPGGERVTLGSYRTKSEAQRALALALGEQSRGRWVGPHSGRVPFTEYAVDWLEHRPGLRPRTLELYESQLRVHLLPVFGPIEVGDITPALVRRWYSKLTASGVPGPVTSAKLYRLLRSILNTAVEDELIPRNPCMIRGAGNEKPAERPVATVEQVATLADVIDPRYRALVLLATYTTLRYGELFALRRRSLDLDAGLIYVVETVGHLATGEFITGPPKSDAGRRTVSIPRSLLPEIAHHLELYVDADSDGFVFRSPSGVVPRRSNWSAYWRRTVKAAGLDGLRFHDLRHTGNTLAASTGASTKELMARMGHASPRAALIYQHATRERDEAIAAGLDLLLQARSSGTTPASASARRRGSPRRPRASAPSP